MRRLLATRRLPDDVDAWSAREIRDYALARRRRGTGEAGAARASSPSRSSRRSKVREIELDVEPEWPLLNPSIAADPGPGSG